MESETRTHAGSVSLVDLRKATYTTARQKARKGQDKFRRDVLAAYGNQCCVTGETCWEVLTAAHIQTYVSEASNHVQDGLALRIDIHALFDTGLLTILTIRPDCTVMHPIPLP